MLEKNIDKNSDYSIKSNQIFSSRLNLKINSLGAQQRDRQIIKGSCSFVSEKQIFDP